MAGAGAGALRNVSAGMRYACERVFVEAGVLHAFQQLVVWVAFCVWFVAPDLPLIAFAILARQRGLRE